MASAFRKEGEVDSPGPKEPLVQYSSESMEEATKEEADAVSIPLVAYSQDSMTEDGVDWVATPEEQASEEHYMPVYEAPIVPKSMADSPPHVSQTINPLFKNHPAWVNYSCPLVKKLAEKKVYVHGKGYGDRYKGIGKPIRPLKWRNYDCTGVQERGYRYNGLRAPPRMGIFLWNSNSYQKKSKPRNAVKQSSSFCG